MASESAMRAGAGYVTACVPASLNLVFESQLLEVMTVPLPDTDGSLEPRGVEQVLERADRVGRLVLGPGLGRASGAQEFASQLARAAPVPLLLDADGLNAHAGDLGLLADREAADRADAPRRGAGAPARVGQRVDRGAAVGERSQGGARGTGDRRA